MAKAANPKETVQTEAPAPETMTQEQAQAIVDSHANIAWTTEPAELTEAKKRLNK